MPDSLGNFLTASIGALIGGVSGVLLVAWFEDRKQCCALRHQYRLAVLGKHLEVHQKAWSKIHTLGCDFLVFRDQFKEVKREFLEWFSENKLYLGQGEYVWQS